MTPKAISPSLAVNFAKDAPPAHPHRFTVHQKPTQNAIHGINKRESLGRELSEAAATGQRESYKKMNAVKRISRNSIVLFSFTGRNKKEKKEMQQAKKDGAEMYPSGSSKQLKEP